MNMYDWNHYIFELQQITYKQHEQIKLLEKRINNLEEQIKKQSSPSVDKVEYHFDQLKIERLDGTLHIGLTPNELANIDDLGIPKVNQMNQPNELRNKLSNPLYNFVNEQGPKMIRDFSEKYQKPIDRKLEGEMIHDILSQIPDRIKFYESEAKNKHQFTSQQQLENYVLDQVKKEVYHSLERFMNNTEK